MAGDGLSAIEAELNEKASKRGRLMALVAVAVVLALVAAAFYFRPEPPPLVENHAVRVADVVPFVELGAFEEGWVGEVDPGWIGVTDPTIASARCKKLLVMLDIPSGQSVQILAPEGRDVVECVAP